MNDAEARRLNQTLDSLADSLIKINERLDDIRWQMVKDHEQRERHYREHKS